MANLNLIDQPKNTVQSVYSPIKFTARVDSTDRNKYPSCKVSIIPRNIDETLDTSRRVDIRVQPSIDIPNYADTESPNTTYLYYTIDVSSILRDFVSYDLRPCTHDTSNNVRRDITMGQMALNTFQLFKVEFFLEEIIDGVLTTSDTASEKDNGDVTAVNSALLHEEEHFLAIGNELLNGASAQIQGNLLDVLYKHSCDAEYEKNRQKYLTTKPVNHRIIGHDESEYLSFIFHDNGSVHPRIKVSLNDFDGNPITNSAGTDYVITIDNTTDGSGNTGSELNSFANISSGVVKPTVSVVQVGVGTRNIKETPDAQWFDSEALTDFSNVGSYTVYTEDTSGNKIGEDITYYIDHTRQRVNGVRFHWQNRLGGIDSYTFDGAFTEGINISSKSYEQSIYPQFRGQLGGSTSDTNVLQGDLPPYHLANSPVTYGATVPRVAGLTDDKYPSVRKSKVKAVKEGTAISRPYGFGEQDMFEDLLASPNVWIEKGWIGKEVFREDWSGYSAVSNITDNWNVEDGDFTTNGSFETAKGHITGTRCYEKGDNSGNDTLWASSKKFVKYNPKSIYEIEVRIKSEHDSTGEEYVGFTGYAANKTTKISTTGADQFGNAHYVTLNQYDQTDVDKWKTFRGYVTGHSTTAAVQSNNVNNPSTAYTGIEFISPMFLLNHDDAAGEVLIDYIVVREYQTDIPNSRGWYSTLNRNYYVPVVVKDASVTTFDNENLQRCTLNYIESKAKRTIE
jgi:hypothetical protein